MKHLLIIGGGIAGLSTAYYAQKQASQHGLELKITLVEKENRLGGKIISDTPDDFVIEGGPDSFITQKPWALQLCRELGLESELIGTNDAKRKTYILRHGKLQPMPDGLMLVVPTRFLPFVISPILSWRAKLRMGLDLFIKPRLDTSDESLADFMRRRLGQEALDVLGEPMLAGIHVADAETMSLKATFPRFIDIEQKYGSLIRGMLAGKQKQPPSKQPLFMTLKGGLSRLVRTLEHSLNARIMTGTGIQAVRKTDTGIQVVTDDGLILDADAVVLAAPAYSTAQMLSDVPGELTDLLNSIRYVSTATVSLGFQADTFEHPLNGFGFVIPHTEKTALLACTWTSTKFDHRAGADQVLLRVFIGGTRHSELVQLSDADLEKTVLQELARIMHIKTPPVLSRIFRWHRSNPQYDVGHLDRVDRIEQLLPEGVYVTGSAYRGVGIPDCVHQAQLVTAQLIEDMKTHSLASEMLAV